MNVYMLTNDEFSDKIPPVPEPAFGFYEDADISNPPNEGEVPFWMDSYTEEIKP